MAWRRVTVRAGLGSVALAAMGAVGMIMASGAAYAGPAPAPRFIDHNVTTCDAAGLTGSILFGGDTESESDTEGSGTVSGDIKTLDVTINVGYTASGIVVKGGDNANVFDGPFTGLVTITGMQSPPVGNEDQNIPQISHWYVCGGTTPPTTPVPTTKPPTTTPPTTAPPTTAPPTTTAPPVTTTTTPGSDDELPVTGVAIGGVVLAGVALVGGGMALLLSRRRRSEATG